VADGCQLPGLADPKERPLLLPERLWRRAWGHGGDLLLAVEHARQGIDILTDLRALLFEHKRLAVVDRLRDALAVADDAPHQRPFQEALDVAQVAGRDAVGAHQHG